MGETEAEVIRGRAVLVIARLASLLGLDGAEIEVVTGRFDGAMSVRRQQRPLMRVNPEVISSWTEVALEGCVAHELGHLVLHVPKTTSRLGSFRLWLACIVSRPLHHLWSKSLCWRIEFEADAFAASLVGREAVAHMILQHVHYSADLELSSWTHPPRRERLRRLGLEPSQA